MISLFFQLNFKSSGYLKKYLKDLIDDIFRRRNSDKFWRFNIQFPWISET